METTSQWFLTFVKIFLQFIFLLFNSSYEFIVRIIFGPIPGGKVRLRNILFRHKIDVVEISRKEDFLLTPGVFVEPTSLDHPNWHIYSIDKDLVTFVYLKSPIEKYTIAHYPFMFVPVHTDAIQVAQICHDDFIELARALEQRPQPRTVLFTNTARCGSTLLAKMLNHPGESVCYGEPHCLTNLSNMDNAALFSEKRMRTLLSATITCLRAHTPSNQVCVLKTTSGEARLAKYCDDVTNLKQIFMFRKNGLLSNERMLRRTEALCIYFLRLLHINPHLTRFIGNWICMESDFLLKCQVNTIKELAAVYYAAPLTFYKKNADKYCHPIVYYHDLMSNTTETLQSLFAAIDIPVECIEKAVACKSEDSQKNSFLAVDKIKHIKLEKCTDEERSRLEQIAEIMGIDKSVLDEA
ncbi:unnamed protein product [Auanema sp. JU1783]|nr:unnamed protein product [Auanema sp. JU1783]